MKLLILDHLKRWWLLWLTIGVANCFIPGSLLDDGKSFFTIYVMLIFWIGAFQLNYDLQRGHGRVLTALPVTPKQIGRAWWLVAVALPALLLAATSGLGLLVKSISTAKAFPASNYISDCITNTFLLGAVFYLVVGSTPGWPQSLAKYVRVILSSVFLIGIMFFGKLAPDTAQGLILLLVIGTLTIAGFFCAEQFVLNRAGFRTASQRTKKGQPRYKAEAGFGGLPFLAARAFIRCLLIGLLMMVFMVVMFSAMDHSNGKFDLMSRIQKGISAGNNFQMWWILLFQLAPTLMHLRFLRTLPVATSTLAITLVLVPVTAIICCGGIIALLAGTESARISILSNYLLVAAFGALAVSVLVWRGMDRDGWFLAVLIMMLGMMSPIFIHQHCPLWFALVGAILLTALACELTRRALIRSNRTYRVSSNPFGGSWGAWR